MAKLRARRKGLPWPLPPRFCQHEDCDVDISHRHGGARFCEPHAEERNGRASRKKSKYHGWYTCCECNEEFWVESGQGFRAGKHGVRCRKCRSTSSQAKHLRWRGDRCQRCGYIPEDICELEVDHIDGSRKNNRRENCQTLCACCHKLKHMAPHIFAKRPAKAPMGFESMHQCPGVVVGKWGWARSVETGEMIGRHEMVAA